MRLLPDWLLNDIEAHALFGNGQSANPAAVPSSTSWSRNFGRFDHPALSRIFDRPLCAISSRLRTSRLHAGVSAPAKSSRKASLRK